MPELPELAMPNAIRMIARAAMPATPSVIRSTMEPSSGSVREAEEARWQVDAHDLELLDELGPDPGRLQPSLDLALDDAGLLEDEHVLHDDDVAFHALGLGDVDDLPGPVVEGALLDDEVDGRVDLLADGPQRQVDSGHEDHRLEPRAHGAWRVGAARAQRAGVAARRSL